MPGPNSVAVPKPLPRAVDKVKAHRAAENLERRIKKLVRERDGYRCVICDKKANEVHEIVPKSRGGVPSLENSITLCGAPRGCCHALCQQRRITVVGEPNEHGRYRYEMPEVIALIVFGRATSLPPGVTVT